MQGQVTQNQLTDLLESEAAKAMLETGDGRRPFSYGSVVARARRAWQDAELKPILLHEARHTYASLMIAAGVNAKALST